MNRTPYRKVKYQSDADGLQEAVDVLQNLPAHCVATTRNAITQSVDIDNVLARCLRRIEQINKVNNSVKERNKLKTYRRSGLPQFPPQRDIDEALSIGFAVYEYLQNWEKKIHSQNSQVQVHKNLYEVPYHEVTHNENRGVELPKDAEGTLDYDDYEVQQRFYG